MTSRAPRPLPAAPSESMDLSRPSKRFSTNSPTSSYDTQLNATQTPTYDSQHTQLTNNSTNSNEQETLRINKRQSFIDSPPTNRRNQSSGITFEPTPEQSQAQEIHERPDYNVKVVCVGDGGCGKTSLMLTYSHGTFPTTYVPTVFENYLATVKTPQGKLIELALWDTAGQEEYDRLRVLSYPEVNVLLVCFAIDSATSLDNVVDKWIPEISHFCQDIPFLLIGLKGDLRKNPPANKTLVTVDQAKYVAANVGAVSYIECSARLSDNIAEVFDKAIIAALSDQITQEEEIKPEQNIPETKSEQKKVPEMVTSSKMQSSTPQKSQKSQKPQKPQKSKKKKRSKCTIL